MNEKEESIIVASVPDREHLVVEVWIGGNLFAELREEPEQVPMVEVYPPPTGQVWSMPLEQLLDLLDRGTQTLSECRSA